MATVTITPSAAKDYQGAVQTDNGNLIGWVYGQFYNASLSVRYTFKSTKKLKGFTAKIKGTLSGYPDGRFRYSLSTSPDYPSSWNAVSEEGSDYLSITYTGEVAANTTYYLFVSKESAGNSAYYKGCSAANVTITGEAVGSVEIWVNGAKKEAEAFKYVSGKWEELTPYRYDGSNWKETS